MPKVATQVVNVGTAGLSKSERSLLVLLERREPAEAISKSEVYLNLVTYPTNVIFVLVYLNLVTYPSRRHCGSTYRRELRLLR